MMDFACNHEAFAQWSSFISLTLSTLNLNFSGDLLLPSFLVHLLTVRAERPVTCEGQQNQDHLPIPRTLRGLPNPALTGRGGAGRAWSRGPPALTWPSGEAQRVPRSAPSAVSLGDPIPTWRRPAEGGTVVEVQACGPRCFWRPWR